MGRTTLWHTFGMRVGAEGALTQADFGLRREGRAVSLALRRCAPVAVGAGAWHPLRAELIQLELRQRQRASLASDVRPS